MRETNLDNVLLGHGIRKTARRTNHSRSVTAFDTETFEGACVLVGVAGDSMSKKSIIKEHSIPKNIDEVLEFLTKRKYTLSHNFFFNLKFDRDAIIKMLPNKNINELRAYNQTYYKDYVFNIQGNRAFQVSRLSDKIINKTGDRQKVFTSHFSDIAIYHRLGSLENTVFKVLGIEFKKSFDIGSGVAREKITDEIVDYCIDDAYHTYLLCKDIVDMSNEFVFVNKFYSPASVSKAFMRDSIDKKYVFRKNDLQKMAWMHYGGGKFEVLRKGNFSKDNTGFSLFSADLNSAYPDILSRLYFPEGLIRRNIIYEPESLYSYFLVDLQISNDFIMSPFKYVIENLNGLLVFPTGKFKDVYINKEEYEIMDNLDCRIRIKKAVHIFNPEPRLWLEGIVDLYARRMKLKKKIPIDRREYILKIILNSLYGITAQCLKVKKALKVWGIDEDLDMDNRLVDFDDGLRLVKYDWMAGGWFNPVIATEITTGTRNRLFNDFHEFEDDVVMVATDSVTMTRPIPFKESEELGGYSIYPEMEGFVLGNGIYEFKSVEDGTIVTSGMRSILVEKYGCLKCKTRFPDSITLCPKCGGMVVKNMPTLHDMFEGNYSRKLDLVRTRPKSLKEGLPDGMGFENPNEFINIFIPFQRELYVGVDKKRNWNSEFNSFDAVLNEVIDSRPLNYS